MSDLYKYTDANGNELHKGDRIRVGLDFGTIVEISDPDGDTNAYGDIVGINPVLTVEFDDGERFNYTMFWQAKGPWDEDAPFQSDDVEKEND